MYTNMKRWRGQKWSGPFLAGKCGAIDAIDGIDGIGAGNVWSAAMSERANN